MARSTIIEAINAQAGSGSVSRDVLARLFFALGGLEALEGEAGGAE